MQKLVQLMVIAMQKEQLPPKQIALTAKIAPKELARKTPAMIATRASAQTAKDATPRVLLRQPPAKLKTVLIATIVTHSLSESKSSKPLSKNYPKQSNFS